MTQGTDGVYGSGNRSAIQQTNADRKGRPGTPLKSNPTPTYNPQDQHPEKYYAANPRSAQPGGVIKQEAPVAMPEIREGVAKIQMKNETDVNRVRDQAIDAVRRGARAVVIVDGEDNAKLERLLRTQMELSVARQQLTEGQYRDVYFNMGVGMPDVDGLIDEIPEAEEDDPMANDIPDFDAFVKRTDEVEIGVDMGAPEGDQTVIHEITPPAAADHIEIEEPLIIGDPSQSPEIVAATAGHMAATMGEDPRPVIESLIPEDFGPDEEFDDEPTMAGPPRRAPRRKSQG
ncbi:MAG: hypothetical protein ACYS7M_00440 [Planctomycetota bacterium]|jgi:hypothetical protein